MNIRVILIWVLLALAADCGYGQKPLRRMKVAPFGNLKSGVAIKQIVLRNRMGMTVKVITYGAIITEIQVPNKAGQVVNVIAGTDSIEGYEKGFPAAAVIGRFANRIHRGRFKIDGKEFRVTVNSGKNHIHGGRTGFAQVNWTAEPLASKEGESGVRLSYLSVDGEEGYPGNLKVTVTYVLTDKNELRIEYGASTDKPTPVNLTNHAYFDLTGGEGFQDHVMWLGSDSYTIVDEELIPTGAIASVKGTPLDFTKPMAIGARVAQIKKYDHNYVINREDDSLVLAARVREPRSGRVMEMRTTQPGVQLYTGNGRGFCLETQHYPDSVNRPEFPSTIVRPGKPFKSVTVFGFAAE